MSTRSRICAMRLVSAVFTAALLVAGCKTVTEEDSQGDRPNPSTSPTTVSPVTARPSPSPDPTSDPSYPPPDEDAGGGEFIPDNDNPVTELIAKVYFVECGGVIIPGSLAKDAAVGCRVHLDATPKDGSGKPTRAKSDLRWTFGGTTSSYTDAPTWADYTPTLTIVAPGQLVASAAVDGVTSNTVTLTLR